MNPAGDCGNSLSLKHFLQNSNGDSTLKLLVVEEIKNGGFVPVRIVGR